MGGYDVYYVELFKNDSTLHRLASPINSPADDIYFKMLADSSVAFVSSNRLGGYGGMDIYKMLFHRFNTDLCVADPSKGTRMYLRGADTVLAGSNLLMNAAGSAVMGLPPRSVHWYLNDSLVSKSMRLELPMSTPGTYDLKLYMSVIDESKLAFHASCTASVVTVLEPARYAKSSPMHDILEGLNLQMSERQLRNAMPEADGELGLANDAFTTLVNNPLVMDLRKNDGEEEEGDLTFVSLSRPLHGTVVMDDAEKGKVIYHPSIDFTGIDGFSYTMRSPYGKTATAYVAIRVLDNAFFLNQKAIKDDLATTQMNQPVQLDLFANDERSEGQRFRISATTLPVNGELKGIDLNQGTVIYQPAKQFVGTDIFTYAVDVPEQGLQKAFVRVQVLGAEGDMPSKTRPDFAATVEGQLLSMNVFLNDAFNAADEPRIISLSKTNHGASQIYDATEGIVVYSPFQAYTGFEHFTYTTQVKSGAKYVEAISVYVEPEEIVLASVDPEMGGTGLVDAYGVGSSITELYTITEIDEDNVDLSKRPTLDLQPIYFDFDKAYVRSDAQSIMDANIELLKSNPSVVIQVMSHCDSRGSKAYNIILSARRAKATMDYLVSKGIDKSRIIASVGVGEDDLINDCGDGIPCSKSDHQLNRRSEFMVVGTLR
jgi:outer membrane protein OmpA-like peptidoglycan-associated protein